MEKSLALQVFEALSTQARQRTRWLAPHVMPEHLHLAFVGTEQTGEQLQQG